MEILVIIDFVFLCCFVFVNDNNKGDDMSMNVQSEYEQLLQAYWSEMKASDTKGQYNAVFKTYSTSQRDVQMKYKTLFTTIQGIADKFKIKLEHVPNIVVEAERDEVLG